jgi:flagellin
MSLGVLNNLSAVYAENNLNNTKNSLNTVLQQLSSGSKINSGADDAAGLSLVDGLQANQQALMQSQTNATEGVGLLQVADGALSQVTSLLNRAVTLATEASNGTLNASQDTAANQEYQSILSEVNNIGTTTTYNNQAVFNSNTNIYTGDSSSTGSSIDALNIRTLSSSNVGDSGGAMAYGTGSNGNNVFVDLSNDGSLASANDSLGLTSASTTIAVSYLTTGTNGQLTESSKNITVGNGTQFANNVQGMISAINGSGLGLTASFGTAAQAGAGAVATAAAALYGGGSGADTGIIISGQGVGTGAAAGEIGSLTTGGTVADPLAGTLNITDSKGASHTLTLGQAETSDNITDLASTINAAGYGITATVSSNTITFTSASSKSAITATNLTDATTAVDGTAPALAGSLGTVTSGALSAGSKTLTLANASDIYTGGTIALVGAGSSGNTTITLGIAGVSDNNADLAKTINAWAAANTGTTLSATVNASGSILTIANSALASGATTAPTVTLSSATSDTVASATAATLSGQPTTALASATTIGTFALTGTGAAATDDLNGTLTIGTNTIALGGTGTTDTLQDLAKTINAGSYGVTATYSQTNKDIVFTSSNASLAATGALSYTAATGAPGAGDSTDISATLAYTAKTATNATTAEAFYTIGLSSSAGVIDQATLVGASNKGGTTNTGMTADLAGANGIATISYTDASGANLSSTDLTNQTNAEATLTALNAAITDVAAQDGYIGAQINTLNSVSSVLSTQQENVQSAQNAVQATDYASATSNMSKYEILSQTGISALAQANSMQQEVTKLLQ